MLTNYPKAIPESLAYNADSLGVCLPRLLLLDEYLRRMVDDGLHAFTGWRVYRRGSLIFSGEYGTQTPNGEPLRADAIYPLQSETKPVLATCAAILLEDGRLDLYDHLQKHFPEFTGENKNEVLLWHLLVHTSGIDDEMRWKYEKELLGENQPYDDAAFFAARQKLGLPDVPMTQESKDEVLSAISLRAPLATRPGTTYSYSSYCYELMKQIIENITGTSLEAFARERIFSPLEMHDTHWFLPEEKRVRHVIRDASFKGGAWINSEFAMTHTSAAGGLKSTLEDMAKFGQMWLQNGTLNGQRILSPSSVRTMTRDWNKKIPPSLWFGRIIDTNWGLGWDLKCGKVDDHGFLRSERSYNHGGFGGACLLIEPIEDMVVSCYFCEQGADSQNDDLGPAFNILYSALD